MNNPGPYADQKAWDDWNNSKAAREATAKQAAETVANANTPAGFYGPGGTHPQGYMGEWDNQHRDSRETPATAAAKAMYNWSAPDARYRSPFADLKPFTRDVLETNPTTAWQQYAEAIGGKAPNNFLNWILGLYNNEYARYGALSAQMPELKFVDYLDKRAPDIYSMYANMAPEQRGVQLGGGNQNLYRL